MGGLCDADGAKPATSTARISLHVFDAARTQRRNKRALDGLVCRLPRVALPRGSFFVGHAVSSSARRRPV